MGLIAELKRRNVLRMAVLYVISAWLVMQVAGALIHLRVLPESLGPWVMAVLVIALIVSWFFEVTPEGVTRESELPEGQPVLADSGRRTDFVIIAMLAAAVILMLVWEPPASADEALTVLPFESMTGPEEASFSQGVSTELLSMLAQLRKFKVKLPPEASILARFSDTQTLAREMGVRWVLRGNVRQAEDRVRIAVQLIDTEDDAAIAWSNTFDRRLSAENLFDIQAEVARSIVGQLRQSLDEPAQQRLAGPPTENIEAYTAYLIGRDRLTDRKVAELADAAEQFARAIELDSDFAGAYSGLFDACILYESYSGGHQHDRCPPGPEELQRLAQRAVELDPELGEAWVSLGLSLELDATGDRWLEKYDEAKRAFERGLELNPSQAQGYLWYADNLESMRRYREPGSFEKAWEARVWQSVIARGLEVNPLSIQLHVRASDYPMWAQTPEEAMYHARRIVEIAPDSPTGLARLAEYSWSLEGRADEAIRWAHKAAQVDPDRNWFPRISAHAYTALGDFDMALAYMDKAEHTLPDERRTWVFKLQRGFIHLHAGRTREAVELLEPLQDQEAAAGMHYALNALTSLDLAAGDYDKALSRYASHRGRCLEDKEVWQDWFNCPKMEFARTLEATGDSDTAVRLLESYFEDVDTNLPASNFLLGRFLIGSLAKGFLNAGGIFASFDDHGVHLPGRLYEPLEMIEKAVEMGYRGHAHPLGFGDWRFAAFHDIRLDHIREHPRFQAAMAIIEGDMAQQLENVRAMQRDGEIPTLEEVRAVLITE
jgi:TolB-like protein